jgi:hypothetical protein
MTARTAEAPAARAAGWAGLALAGAATAGTLAAPKRARRRGAAGARPLHAAAALLAGSVLADSAVEHYRGGFENPGMYAPLLVSGAAAVTGAREAAASPGASASATIAYAAAAGLGLAGAGFHLFNILKRPGGLDWLNLFYAAPIAAPAALTLAGLIGLAAERIGAGRERLLGRPAGRALSALVAAGLAGTAAEAGLYHYRGAFQNPLMWLPVSLPPAAAALMAATAADPGPRRRRSVTRGVLAVTALLGFGGAALHAFGVSRAMGGWRNWRQNLLDGPPLPAPPAFAALALAGLAALALIEREAGARA